MSKNFKIGTDEIVFDGPVVEYNELKLFSDNTLSVLSRKYIKDIAGIDDADEASDLIQPVSNQFIHEYYMSFDEYFLNKGMFDFSEDSLDNSPKIDWALEPMVSSIYEYSQDINEINGKKREEIANREIRKESRSRVIGGGFGLGGAIQGMVTAGAINTVTGLAHDVFNVVGDAASTYSAYSKKHKRLDVFKKEFISSLLESSHRIFSIINEQLGTSIAFDTRKAENITNNVCTGKIKDNIAAQALKAAILADPYYGKAYVVFAEKFPSVETDLTSIAKFFHTDLGEDYTIFDYVFSTKDNRKLAGAFLQRIDEQIDAVTYEGCSSIFYHFDTLISKRCLVFTQLYLNYLKQEISKNPQDLNDEITEFKQYALQKFESLRKDIIGYCQVSGFQIGKMSLEEVPSELTIYLAVKSIQTEADFIYYGDIVPSEPLESYCKEENSKAISALDSQIYLFMYNGYDDSLNCIFCDKGIGGLGSTRFTHQFIPFDEIDNIWFKSMLGSKTLRINGKLTVGGNLVHSDFDNCAPVIKHVLKTLTGKDTSSSFFNSDSDNKGDNTEGTASGLISSVKSASMSAFNKVAEVGTKASETIKNNDDNQESNNSAFSSFTSSIISASKSAFNKASETGTKATESLLTTKNKVNDVVSNTNNEEVLCPNCGATISKGKKFCGNCGTKIVMDLKRTCPSCGAEIAEGKKFCGMCGTKL